MKCLVSCVVRAIDIKSSWNYLSDYGDTLQHNQEMQNFIAKIHLNNLLKAGDTPRHFVAYKAGHPAQAHKL